MHVCSCACVCICTRAGIRACSRVHVRVHAYVCRACMCVVRACVCAFERVHAHVCVCVCMLTCARTCVCACLLMVVCMRGCVHVRVRARTFTHICVCLRVHLCTQVCVHACARVQGCVNADVRACGGGWMHICASEECACAVSVPASSPPYKPSVRLVCMPCSYSNCGAPGAAAPESIAVEPLAAAEPRLITFHKGHGYSKAQNCPYRGFGFLWCQRPVNCF